MDFLACVLATAFVVSTVDYAVYLGAYRIPLAVAAATAAVVVLPMHDSLGASMATVAAAAFAALTVIAVVDRVVSVAPARGRR